MKIQTLPSHPKPMNNRHYILNFIVFLLVSTMSTQNTKAQKQMNNWFWGDSKQGLTFNNLNPISLPYTNNFLFNFANICVSDSSGNFLFACNGRYFYNKYGEITDELHCTYGIISSILYLPVYNKPFQFYVFITGEPYYLQTSCNNLYYCVYDTSLNNGKGGLVSRDNILASDVYISLAAAPHANGKDYWVTARQFSTGKILSFGVSENGVRKQSVVSFSYSKQDSNQIAHSKMRFNHNGTKLCIPNKSNIEIYNFDNSNAKLSHQFHISIDSLRSAEFSSDDTKLYATTQRRGVFQIDLSSNDSVRIKTSIKNIFDKATGVDIQLGPDRKMYFLREKSNYPLFCINSPNSTGKYCRPDSVNILYNNSTPHISLPYYITPFLYEPFILDFPDEVCPEEQVYFQLKNGENASDQAWSFGDGTSWTGAAAQHSFQQNGVYEILATITDKQNKTYKCRKEITVRNKTKTIKEIKHD